MSGPAEEDDLVEPLPALPATVNNSPPSHVWMREGARFPRSWSGKDGEKESEMNMVAILVPWGFFLVIGWLAWVIASNVRRSKVARVQAEVHAKLFDKFGSSQDLLDYLRSEAGQRFLESATIEHARPFGRILGSIQAGVILTLVGIGFLFLRGQLPDAMEPFLVFGVLALALGFGFALSAGIAYVLSRKQGLLERSAAGAG